MSGTGFPRPNFIRFDLGPTFEVPVLVDADAPDAHAFHSPKFVELRRGRVFVAIAGQSRVELQIPDRRYRKRLDRLAGDGRQAVVRLRLGGHASRADVQAGHLQYSSLAGLQELQGPLVVAIPEEVQREWSGGLETVTTDMLARQLLLRLPGSLLPYAVARLPFLIETNAEQREVHVLSADGHVLVGVLAGGAGHQRVEIQSIRRERREEDEFNRLFGGQLFQLHDGVRVVMNDEASTWMDSADISQMIPPSNPVLDAWMRYHTYERELAASQVASRSVPLAFDDAQHRGDKWTVQIRAAADHLSKWADVDGRGRAARVRQTIRLAATAADLEGGELEGELTDLRQIDRGAGTAVGSIVLSRKSKGSGHVMPVSGVFVAIQSRGSQRQQERRLEATQRLLRGECPNPRVLDWLTTPSAVEPPVHRNPTFRAEPPLNRPQRKAVAAALGTEDVVLVQGPPGTGKTQVIVEVLLQLAAECRKEPRPFRVLLSSIQNDAVSNAVQRLRELGDVGEGLAVQHLRKRESKEASALDLRETTERVCESLRAGVADSPPVRLDAAFERIDESLQSFEQGFVVALHERAFTDAVEQLDALLSANALSDVPEGLRLQGTNQLRELQRVVAMLPSEAPPEPAVPTVAADESAFALLFDGPCTPASLEQARALWPAEEPMASHVLASLVGRLLKRSACGDALEKLEKSWNHVSGCLAQELVPAVDDTAPIIDRARATGEECLAWSTRTRAWVADERDRLGTSAELVRIRLADALTKRPRAWTELEGRYAGVVAVTCQRAADMADDIIDQPFDLAIIDEAGRASPFDLLIPMTLCRRCLLIGDQRQLPPTVEDEILSRVEKDHDIPVDLATDSLFSHLFETVRLSNAVALDIQYRMHEVIGSLVSDCFYDGRLRSYFAGPLAQERLSNVGLFDNAPLVWIDTAARCGRVDRAEDNDVEVELVGSILEQLQEIWNSGGPVATVGIITFYGAQRERLESLIQSRPSILSRVELGTVDSFQGREFDIVILSTVKHSRRGKMGFLALPNRVNVAFSRARRQLIVLGSEETAVKHREAAGVGSPFLARAAQRARKLDDGRFVLAAEVLGERRD